MSNFDPYDKRFGPYHKTASWDRPLTPRQSYWLGCVQTALARLPKNRPAALIDIRKVDKERNGGTYSVAANVAGDALLALEQRRWLTRVSLTNFYAPADKRCAPVGYELADRALLDGSAARAMELEHQVVVATEHIEAINRALLSDGITMREDEEQHAWKNKRRLALKELEQIRADMPREGLNPLPIPSVATGREEAAASLLAACEPRAARPKKREHNPYT